VRLVGGRGDRLPVPEDAAHQRRGRMSLRQGTRHAGSVNVTLGGGRGGGEGAGRRRGTQADGYDQKDDGYHAKTSHASVTHAISVRDETTG
jgi:hypothetical protein